MRVAFAALVAMTLLPTPAAPQVVDLSTIRCKEFLDSSKEYILCSIHGAAYEPRTGRCVAGPCGRGKLTELRVEEHDGQVYWYPSRDTRPAFTD